MSTYQSINKFNEICNVHYSKVSTPRGWFQPRTLTLTSLKEMIQMQEMNFM
jgi:hypothetical protein